MTQHRRLISLAARWIGAAYPSRSRLEHEETTVFLRDALEDAWTRRRWLGLAGMLRVTAADLWRCWTGRAALPLSPAFPFVYGTAHSRRTTLMDQLMSDLRYSVRLLTRTPAFTAVAVATLALGIGSATAVYAVTDAVLIRPFPYPDMNRIALLTEVAPNGQGMSVSWPNYQDWVAQNEVFDELGVYRGATVTMTGGDQAERLNGAIVSASVFATMGIPPARGRLFNTVDDSAATARVAIISERLWRSHFAARDSVVGERVMLNSQLFEIVGVMPPAMRFPSRLTDVWLPLGLSVPGFPPRGAHPGLTAVGRIKAGVDLEGARSAMTTIAARLAELYPNSNKGGGIAVNSYYEQVVQNIRPALYMLLATVGLLVLIACTNLASLMLARSDARQRELALRAALGAARVKLLRQLLVESSLLASLGGALGLGLAWIAVRTFVASNPSTVPRIDLVGIDWRVASFALVLSALTVILFAVVPALRASTPNLQDALRDGRGGAGRRSIRMRRVLVATQVAVAVILLVGAGLLAKSLGSLLSIDLGFNPDKVVTMRLTIPDAAYPTPEAWVAFHRSLVERLASIPGVQKAGINSALPLQGGGSESPVMKEGDPPPAPDRPMTMTLYQASGGEYFDAMGIELLKGRLFKQGDTGNAAPVAVVDDTLAQKLFGTVDIVGRRIAFEFDGHDAATFKPRWREVVGVVRHVKHYGLVGEPPYVQIYAPFEQIPLWMEARRPAMAIVVRTAGDPTTIVADLRRTVAAIDPRIPVYSVQAMDTYVGQTTEQPRLSAALVTMFAAVALMLSAVGLYGVLSYLVSLRTREIGVRLALGAKRSQIVRQVIGQGLGIAVAGLVAGVGAALAATQLLKAMLFNVSPTDVSTFATVIGVLAVVAVIASAVPARRASGVDPLSALKAD
ncbi:MAG TPA: ABC transporter permease [Vicinamibacterales bacterium]|nr:ABC transporter permease [Vicinamibacterales bacterium]